MNLLITYMEKLQHQESQQQEHWLPINQEMENDFSSLIRNNTYTFDCIKIIFAHNNYYSEKVIRNNFKQALTLFKVCPCLMPSQYACFFKDGKEIARCTIDWTNKDVKNYLDNIPYNIEINLNDLI